MANLNLSEFTEKLFVADADHTFIWDTQNAISKRVSRNSWLNSGTLTSDAPVTISQTWNQIGTAFTAFKVNAVSTASASGSLLLDLQVGGTSVFKVSKTGSITANNTINLAGSIVQSSGNFIPSNALIFDYFNQDVVLQRDGAANTLALRNGTAAQTFNIYASYSDASNYSRLSLGPLDGGGKYYILANNAGTGIARGINIRAGASQDIFFGNGTTDIVKITATGLSFVTDNAYDISASGANRPRNVYVGTDVIVGGNYGVSAAGRVSWSGKAQISSPSDSVIRLLNAGSSNFNLLQFGGGTDAFPAIKRNAAGLQIRLADDSANATLEAGNLYASGNVGIGTTSPSSKLQVSAGDVEVDTIAKGVILKSPDGTRYRVTVANGGTLSVAAV